jgi:hypothetical protein
MGFSSWQQNNRKKMWCASKIKSLLVSALAMALSSNFLVATVTDPNYQGRASGTLAIAQVFVTDNFLDWQFSDADGTLLNRTYNFGTRTVANLTGTLDNWSGGGMATQGGVLNIGDTASFKWNPNRTSNGGQGGTTGEAIRTATLSTPLTSGKVIFEYRVANWNLGGTDGRGVTNDGVRLLVGDSASNSVSLEFEVNAAPGDDIRVQSTVAGNGSTIGGSRGGLVNATALVVGTAYVINTPGTTDWSLVGAPNNNAGTLFTATAVGTGTGTANTLARLPANTLGAVNLVGSPTNFVTLQLLADLNTGIWSTRAKVGATGAWLPLATHGIGLTRINRIQLIADAANGTGWQHGGVEGVATEFVQIDSVTLGTEEAFNKPVAPVSLGNLAVTYDGTAKAASVTTVPAGLNVDITYNGSTTVPTNAGSYVVVGKFNDATYQGTALGTLVIDKAAATINFPDLTPTFDGTAKPISVTTTPPGLIVNVTYDGSTTAPTAAGSYAVVAVVDDVNYRRSANRTLVIGKATATVSLGDLASTFDGTPKAASVTTVPAGLNVGLTYNGSATVPTAAGSYAVVATVNDSNYQGTASGTLIIGKATAMVTLGNLAANFDATPKSATATTDPAGLNVAFTYNGSTTAPTSAGSYAVVATVNDPDYQGTASGTLVISLVGVAETFLDWQFSDADGTLLNRTYNFGTRTVANLTGTLDNWSGAGMATQGGVLNIGDTATLKWNPNSTSNGGQGGAAGQATRTATLSTPLTSGKVIFEYRVANWNLGGSDGIGDPNNGVRFLVGDSASNSVSLEFEVTASPIDDIRAQSTVSGTGSINGGTRGALVNATALVVGTAYIINDPGTTDWSLVGAPNNNVGTLFTATAVGTGTGTANTLSRLPFDRLGAANLVGSPSDAVTLQLLADLDTGIWSTRARVGASGAWLPLATHGIGLTRIDRIQLLVDAANGTGWHYGGVEGVATEFVQIDSVTLGTLESFSKPTATATLGNLDVTFNGTPRAASVTTVPEGLSVDLTYNGSTTVPTNAGSYVVVGRINDPVYQGTALGTLVIDKATATVALGNLAANFDATPKVASASTEPAGLNVAFTYNGSTTAPTSAGSYAVVATVNDPDYQGTVSGTLVISLVGVAETFLDWQFSDADGTLLNRTYNFGASTITNLTGTLDNWSGAGMATQGGVLNIGDTADFKWNPNKTSNGGQGGVAGEATRTATLSTPLTSGKVIFEYRVANWNLGGTDGFGSTNNGVRFLVGNSDSNSVSLEFEVGAAPADDIRVLSTVAGTGSIVGGTRGALVNATALVLGNTYIINAPGTTNWELVGAPNNTAGTIFTATAVGTGTGTANALGRSPFDRLGAANLVGSTANAVTIQLLADLDTGIWSTRARVGASGNWLPLATHGIGLTRIDRIELVADAGNGTGWQYGGVEGVATEFVQIDSVTLGTLESFSKPTATATLGDLDVTFNGTPRAASVTTVPEGLSVDLTYNGSTTVPTNAGSYVVVGRINDPVYQGTALGMLVIDKAAATATISNLTAAYNGTARPVSVTTVPAGLTVNVTYDASATAPTAAGSYAAVAVVDDINYRRRSTGTLVISKANATITGLTGQNKPFDGTTSASASGIAALSGVFGSDEVILSGTPSFTFDSANIGTGIPITTSGYTLTGAHAGNYNLILPSLSANITTRELTITGLTGENKTYDGSSIASASGMAILNAVFGTDDVTLSGTPIYTFDSANAGSAVAITTTGYILSGADAGKYTLAQPSLSANITAKELTISGLTGQNKVYDGETDATASGTASLNGVVGDDEVTLDGAADLNFVSANVGTGISITSSGYTLTGTDAGNYALTQPSLSANITAKELTITGLTGDNKPFDGNTDATASGTAALSGLVGTDDVTLAGTPVFTFTSSSVGTGIAITTSGYTLTGTAAINYTLTQPSLSGNITSQEELTISGLTGDSKTYDGTTNATASGTATLVGVAVGDEVILAGTPVYTFDSANVGTAIEITTTGYTLSGADAGKYTLAQPSLSANITAKELTITGLTGENKVYDGETDATASGTASLNGVVGDDEVTLDGAAVLNFVSANVGTGIAITSTGYSLNGANAGNYTLTQPGLSANITAKELTITGLTGEDKPFDGNAIATVSGTASLDGVVGSDEVTLAGTPVFTFASANSGVGIAITATGYSLGGANAGNYTLTLPSLSATIFEDPLFTNPENVPRIARLPGGGVRLTFKGVLGRTYAIQRSTTLLDGSWTQISTVMADHDPEIIFDDPEAPANSAFYRVGIPAQ